ncbi:MAG: hypothetical protein AAGN46_10820 [Acidobacteriota bacterium]
MTPEAARTAEPTGEQGIAIGTLRAEVSRVDPTAESPGWLERGGGRLLIRLLYAACALVLVVSLVVSLVGHAFDHAHFGFERFFAFYALWGFASFFGLVLVAKAWRRVVERPEDYYGDDRPIDPLTPSAPEAAADAPEAEP